MNILTTNKSIILSIFKIFLCTLILTIMTFKFSEAIENKILMKINNEIITTIDISKEISYLKAFNKSIGELDKNKIIEIAKNSIIKERIKEIEILKITKNRSIDKEYLDNMIRTTYLKIGLNSLDQFKKHLENYNITLKMIENKLTLDAYWRQIIYSKYKNKIKIDKQKILTEISNKKNKVYNISEIMFNIEKNENLKEKFISIKQSINNNGFENTALIYGISESSKNGGNLGWINQTAISSKIESELSQLNIGEFTNPIIVPGGFLIIKINNFKEESVKIDIDKELKKVVDIKINEQLNQFSNLYINKVKKSIIIDEL